MERITTMAKDMVGNIIKVGHKILLAGNLYTVKEINENRIFGARTSGSRATSMKIQDEIIVEASFPYDSEKAINCVVIQEPPETGASEA